MQRDQDDGGGHADQAGERGDRAGMPCRSRRAARLTRCTLLRVIPWIIIAVVAVPLVVIAFLSMRRNVTATEQPETDDERARTEQEFAEAEAFEAQWHEEDKERFHQERLP